MDSVELLDKWIEVTDVLTNKTQIKKWLKILKNQGFTTHIKKNKNGQIVFRNRRPGVDDDVM